MNFKPTTSRLQSVDLLRGAVMVLMAVDHVRVYSGVPAGGPTVGIFFTRWITHFCAPGFAFLAGVSIFLYGWKLNDKRKLATYQVTRGLLLVIFELTLIRFGWTFSFDYSEFILAGVIWMLGWCMVLMAALIWLRPAIAGIIGLAIIAGQEIFKYASHLLPPSIGKFYEFIYPSGLEAPGHFFVLYVLVPWIGVMAVGYGFGSIMLMDPVKRKKLCLRIGLTAILIFIVAGTIILLQQSSAPDTPPFIMRLLNQRKYPASPLFLLMTLGPLIALIPFAERVKGWLANIFVIFGKVPFFYYLLHIPLIHVGALIVNLLRTGQAHGEWYNTAPFTNIPEDQRWGLGLLYLLFVGIVAILYLLCRWYANYKDRHPEKKWLKLI
jgi:uncharacterized membrane protein